MSLSPSSSGFVYDPDLHRYTLDGRVIPGITKVLELTGFVDKQWFTEASRRRGTEVHRACLFLAENDLDWNTVAPEHQPRVEGFARFLEDVKPTLLLAEKPLHSEVYSFGGTPDFVFNINAETWIVDAKTGKAGLAAELQTAAQEVLIRERMMDAWTGLFTRVRRFALELPERGKYRLVPHKDPGDELMFLNAVAMVHRRINKGELSL
jgi:hypothetical protein